MSRIWIDIDVLFSSSSIEICPPSVLRVVLEICQALQVSASTQVGFVRRKGGPQNWVCVDWSDVQDLPAVTRYRAGALHLTGRQVSTTKPSKISEGASFTQTNGVADVLKTQLQVLRAGSGWFGAAARYSLQRWQDNRARRTALSKTAHVPVRRHRASVLSGSSLREVVRPGDLFLALGPTWEREDYPQTVRWLRDVLRVRFGLFVHDLLPVYRQEWFLKNKTSRYGTWHQTILPLVDQVFVDGVNAASEVTTYLAQISRPLLQPIVTVPLGTAPTSTDAHLLVQERGEIGVEEEYVLCVGTLEPRKNHELLLRVWRRLLQVMPGTTIPKLILVGEVGWLVSDLMQQLENSDWLNGHVQLVSAPSDAQLEHLYRNCLFTVAPSLAGGVSLPVLESLHYGKPCLASQALAGNVSDQGLVKHFDPLNLHDALRVIRHAIEDRHNLKQWAKEIENRFKPVSWRQSAETILRHTV